MLMSNEHIVKVHGCVSIGDLPIFTAQHMEILVSLSRPGIHTLDGTLAYCINTYTNASTHYTLLVDIRRLSPGENLDLEAIISVGYGEGAEKARAKISITLDHETPSVEHHLQIGNATTSAVELAQTTGAVAIPALDATGPLRLIVSLHQRQNNIYTRIAENAYQIDGQQQPFSLYFDPAVLDPEQQTGFHIDVYDASKTLLCGYRKRNIDPLSLGVQPNIKLKRPKKPI